MIEVTTELYDALDEKLAAAVEENQEFLATQRPEDIAAFIAFDAVGTIITNFDEMNEDSEPGESPDDEPEDVRLLTQRIRAAIQGVDRDRVLARDFDYCRSAFKEAIDLLATPSAEENEYFLSEESDAVWEALMDLFRQVQAFYEAKVTSGDISELDKNA